MNTSELASALQRLAAEATSSPPATPASAPTPAPASPAPPGPVTHLSQLLAPETIAALARLEEHQRADAQAAEADVERAWSSWERNAGMGRPEAVDPPAGSAALTAGTEDLAWLRPDPADVVDVRYGYGDGHQLF